MSLPAASAAAYRRPPVSPCLDWSRSADLWIGAGIASTSMRRASGCDPTTPATAYARLDGLVAPPYYIEATITHPGYASYEPAMPVCMLDPYHYGGGGCHHWHCRRPRWVAPRVPPAVGVGVAFGGGFYDVRSPVRMPGWDAGTIAFHSDDGKLYDGAESSSTTLSAPWHDGGIAGVGVLPPDATHANYRLVLTLNGTLLLERPMGPTLDISRLRWAVGIIGRDAAVYVNPGAAPYAFPAASTAFGVAPIGGAGGPAVSDEAAVLARMHKRRGELVADGRLPGQVLKPTAAFGQTV